MGRIWSDENKFRCWLRVESAASLTLAEAGIVPENAARAIAERGDFDLKRIHEIEAEVKHDVIAFTTAVAEKVGPEARWLHYGLTSNDVVDTAQALQIKDVSRIIAAGLEELKIVLARRAHEFEHTPTIGRTHGIHAEPTTFGLKLANWYAETVAHGTRRGHHLRRARHGGGKDQSAGGGRDCRGQVAGDDGADAAGPHRHSEDLSRIEVLARLAAMTQPHHIKIRKIRRH